MTHDDLALPSFFAAQLADDGPALPARVASQQRGQWEVWPCRGWPEGGSRLAVLSSQLEREAPGPTRPSVGDWVTVVPRTDGPSEIQRTLDRQSQLVRRAAGRRAEVQVVAANVDTVFVVVAFAEGARRSTERRSANVRRVERYLVSIRQAGASGVILVNKADVTLTRDEVMTNMRKVAGATPVLAVSAATGEGIEDLLAYLSPDETFAFVGSSGVGKSSLVNRLIGESVADVGAQRSTDERGRHTTTGRAIHRMPGGALLLDTPGMREFGLVDDDSDALDETFEDVASLADACRFRDCSHDGEPGCAVGLAVERGELEAVRVQSFLRLRQQLGTSREEMTERKRRWEKQVTRFIRDHKKRSGKR